MELATFKDVFINNLLPVLLCAATGFILGRGLHPDIKTASRLAFYIFSPCLVFQSLAHVKITGGEFGKLALFSLAVSLIIGVLSFAAGKALQAGRQVLASLVIASMFVNSGNYGLAATKFAFGESALARAMVCFVFSTVMTYTAGVLIASMGKSRVWQAFKKLLAVPAFYGLIAGAVVRHSDLHVPVFLDRSVSMLGDASIPLMLVLLGLQIADARIWPGNRIRLIGIAVLLQIILTPLVALAMAQWMGLTGVTRQAAVLQASMPAAVVTTVLAVEYELDTALISGTVVLTTLLSPLTLTPLIAYLLKY
jgi:predicted permease